MRACITGLAAKRRPKAPAFIHLKNPPHTPEHNTHAERGVMELKRELEIPRGRLPPAPEDLAARVIGA